MAEEETSPEESAPPAAAPETPPVAGDWRSGFSNDLRDSPSLSKFDNADGGPVSALAKAYTNLEPKIAEKGMILPREDASLESIRSTFTELGCPVEPAGYKLEGFELPGGDAANHFFQESLLESMKDAFWHAGISDKQTTSVMNAFVKHNEKQIEQGNEMLQEARGKAEAELKQEWGGTYSQNLKDAEAAAQWLYGDQTNTLRDLTFRDGAVLGNNAHWIRGLARLGTALRAEGNLPDGKPAGGMSLEKAQSKLAEMNADPELRQALRRNDHPKHQEVVALRRTLYEIIHGNDPAEGQNITVTGDETLVS